MQLLLPATVLSFMASTASAQYGGILFARGPGECPKHAQSDEEMTFSYAGGKFWDYGNNLISPNSSSRRKFKNHRI